MDNLYSIKYSPAAREDLFDIADYISEEYDAPEKALLAVERIEKDIARLREFPYIAPKARDEYLAMQGYRTLVSDRYLVFYKVDDNAFLVTVHRVVHGKRNLEWLFPR